MPAQCRPSARRDRAVGVTSASVVLGRWIPGKPPRLSSLCAELRAMLVTGRYVLRLLMIGLLCAHGHGGAGGVQFIQLTREKIACFKTSA